MRLGVMIFARALRDDQEDREDEVRDGVVPAQGRGAGGEVREPREAGAVVPGRDARGPPRLGIQ